MMKQMVFFAFTLLCLVQQGWSTLQCYKCTGDIETCNEKNAERVTCSYGKDYCGSVVTNTDPGINFQFACASTLDCKAARASCKAKMENNPGVSCNATCCDSNFCVKPYAKENNPRQCYECHSMTECSEKAKAKRCTSDEERCMKVMTEVAYKDSNLVYKTYSKGCATMDQCTNMKKNVFYSDCTDGDKCHMSCCEGDLCNAGSSFVVSASTLFACAVFTVFRLR
ncbi:hypothetical protein ABFA07_003024 [Porites harrisoni]